MGSSALQPDMVPEDWKQEERQTNDLGTRRHEDIRNRISEVP